MAYIAYKTKVHNVKIDGRHYTIEERDYITEGGFTSHCQNATLFMDESDIPQGYLYIMVNYPPTP